MNDVHARHEHQTNATRPERSSRLPGFYRLSVAERLQRLVDTGWLQRDDLHALLKGSQQLALDGADKMIENVIGVMGMPVGLGLNFLINDKDYVVPLAVEEPSIVAALSSAAKQVREAGGFHTRSTAPVLIGQVQVLDVVHAGKARDTLLRRKDEIINLANSLHPHMVARGGGVENIEVAIHSSPDGRDDMVVLHLLVNTCDAMGANLVNTMCEGVAPLVERMTGGRVLLRILSNLADRSLVWAEATIPVALLADDGRDGSDVRDGIIRANDLATVDPYRAATHNKGVMNGVDAVAVATGNDWRALEAAAHAYAARGRAYTSLTRWYANDDGDLVGRVQMPMQVGIVGGNLKSNPAIAIHQRLLGVKSGRELAEVMGAVGLAQNFSALRALVTDGIQEGHMTLHARSVAMAAEATPDIFDEVVERLLAEGEIKVWKAREIIADLRGHDAPHWVAGTDKREDDATWSVGHGKVILLGEHAVVYGRHAIAAPLPLTVRARVEDADHGVRLVIPAWGVEQTLQPQVTHGGSFLESLAMLIERLDLGDRSMEVQVHPEVPRAAGLGSSSALAVAVIRALDDHFALDLDDEAVCQLAFACEKIAHGTPSGIDNTAATYDRPILFRPGDPPQVTPLQLDEPLPLVIGLSGAESLTAKTVARVRQAWRRNPSLYERVFDEIDNLTLTALQAIRANDLQQLGEIMNICQGQLNAMQVSSWALEELIQLARDHGAAGAKLTGGGGGAMIALCPDGTQPVLEAMRAAGYQALDMAFGG